MNHNLRGELALVLCAALWSTGGLFIKLVDASPMVIAGGRSLLALGLILLLNRPNWRFTRLQIGTGVAYAVTMISFVAANKLTTSANAILIQYAAPVYVAFLAAAILKERIGAKELGALGAVAVGTILFFAEKLSGGGLAGNLVAVLSGIAFAIWIVGMRAQKDGSTIESLIIAHGLTFLVSLPFWPGFSPSAPNLLGIGALGIFQIGISALLFAYGIKHVPAIAAVLITTLEPVLNPVWVFLATGETPSPMAFIGGGLIIAAVLLLQISQRRTRDKSPKLQ